MKTHIAWFCVAVIALIVGTRLSHNEEHIVNKSVDVKRTKEMSFEKPVELNRATHTQVEKVVDRKAASPSTHRPGSVYERQRLLERYQMFLGRLDLTQEQKERFIDLKLFIREAHNDLQMAVANNQVPGGSAGVAALRTQFTKPYWDEFIQLLGFDGYNKYLEYERTTGFLPMAQSVFQASGASISDGQLEQLSLILFKNKHLFRETETDINMRVKIDWGGVARDAEKILTPSQLALIRAKAMEEPFP